MSNRTRAIAIVGMHRSGTSAVARGLEALGVYLGDDFLDAQPENPTGYWEDRRIVALDDRVLKLLGLVWDDAAPIDRRSFRGWRMWRLRREAIRDLRRRFFDRPLWGFKDPRTLRVLPFWLQALREGNVDDAYVLVIRNPSSVAASLHKRQQMSVSAAQRLWLAHLVPFLGDLADKPFVVVDYDLLMADPREQLERIARALAIEPVDASEIERFAGEFLDEKLRHSVFSLDDIDTSTEAGRLTREAFALLQDLATDRSADDAAFWAAWQEVTASFDAGAARPRSG
jgi:hypothetical protein